MARSVCDGDGLKAECEQLIYAGGSADETDSILNVFDATTRSWLYNSGSGRSLAEIGKKSVRRCSVYRR